MSPAACRFVRLVDRHFAAHIRPVQERILRAHVADCVVCRIGIPATCSWRASIRAYPRRGIGWRGV